MKMFTTMMMMMMMMMSSSALGHLQQELDQNQEDLGQDLGQDQDLGLGEDLDLVQDLDQSEFDSDQDQVLRRIRRQLKTILTKQENKPHVHELFIRTTIISRYAFTAVHCVLLNRHSAAAEGVFNFQVPAEAFISNFTMVVGGRVFQSEVTARDRKKVKGQEDKSKNKPSDGSSSQQEVEAFRMAVNIPGKNRAVFLLMYEQLLQRRLGRYEHVTSLRPLQLVSRLRLDITVVDHAPITELQVLPLSNGRSNGAANGGANAGANGGANGGAPVTTVINNDPENNVWTVSFSPNIIQQAKISTSGILGDFLLRYDVQRDLGIGDVQVLNGHFVHYFAPKDLPVVPKNVVFVIDTSASMLGKKIRQTKEALFTILKDLRPDDRFNFISFSNRVKVWQRDRLVPVNPLTIRDAKKFIFTLMPTGATNIDEAIQIGSALLRQDLARPESSPNSVSLIIFLTDGRPTVGEQVSTAILGNTRSAVEEKFCIFTIGIGNDVDYRLLDRMALENCGMMRKISEEEDASAMLKGFYDEIGTPLLSDIRVNYTSDSVEYVTQNLFTNYFNGSELVIAGKLTNESAESLHVQVTASNNDKNILLETDVPLRRRQIETRNHVKAAMAALNVGSQVSQGLGGALTSIAEDFVERVWGFLSVKEGLRSRLRSQTSREREDHVQQVTNLSLTYNFLTPLTHLVVEKPQIRADGTLVPEEPTVTPGSGEDGSLANQLPEGQEEGIPGGSDLRPSGQSSSPVRNTIGKSGGRPVKKSVTISRTSADGDPHFVVDFPDSKLSVCFNINGEPGDVLRLVSDHKNSGVTVNGKLIGAPPPPGSHKQLRTYFSSITIVVDRPRRTYIEVTPKKVILDGRDRLVLSCSSSAQVDDGTVSVSIVGTANVTVMVGDSVSFVVLLHRYKNPAPYQRDHLGFYIAHSKGLSRQSHGLLGQFLYEEVGVARHPAEGDVLKVKDRRVPVVRKSRRILGGTQSVDCWFARNNGHKLIDGDYRDYVVPHAFATDQWRQEVNRL